MLLLFMASAALARDREKIAIRTLLLSEHPDDAAHRLFVKGQVVTVVRFEQPCDPGKTKLLGWEGRFEAPACVGKRVVLEPLRDLDPDEAVPLLVTLMDGTEIPFLLRPPKRAVVFKVKNLDSKRAWSVQRVRLTTLSKGDERVAALHSTAPEIAPGTSGVVAIVVDGSTFVDEGGLTSLFLEIYRHDGRQQGFVQLDPGLIGK